MPTVNDSIHVLHVDDEPDFADLAAQFIERQTDRISVDTAIGVDEALDRIGADDFDCIVSDYDMPRKTGIDFLKILRADDNYLPFILYTGKGSEEVASEAISAGVTDYLQKESGTSHYELLANRIENAVSSFRREQERLQYEHAVERTGHAVYITDPQGTITYVNPAFERITGYPQEEAIGQTPRILKSGEMDEEYYDDLWRTIRSGEVWKEEIINQRRTGETYTASQTIAPILQDSQVTGFVAVQTDITEKKEREQELEQLKNRYQGFIETTSDVITVIDENGVIHYASPAVDHVLGYIAEELVGETVFDYIHPDDRDRIRETLSALLEAPGMVTERVEYRFKHADGSWVWLETAGSNQTDTAIGGYVVSSRDVTERKESQAEILRLNEVHETVLSNIRDTVLITDDKGRFTYICPNVEFIFGYDKEDVADIGTIEGLLGDRLIEPGELESGGEIHNIETAVEDRGGREHKLLVTVSAVDIEDGSCLYSIRDITDRVERTDEMERRAERLQFVESVGDIGYWEINPDGPEGHEVSLSDGGYELHGLTPEETFDIERGIDMIDPDDRPRLQQAIEQAIEEAEPYDFEVQLITANGDERWVHTVGEPVMKDGEVSKVRGVFLDVTKRKLKERELERQNDRLAEFASLVSHELRSRLQVAGGNLELALEDDTSEELTTASEAIDRALSLIDQLVTLARDGAELDETELLDIAELTDAAWNHVATEEARLRIKTDRVLEGDPSRIQQVLENLFVNAVTHGGEDVTVTVGDLISGFYVEDDGPGIPEVDREKVFTPGYSTGDSRTGFGLSIVKRVVEAHGWDISATEGSDGGARMEITGVENNSSISHDHISDQ